MSVNSGSPPGTPPPTPITQTPLNSPHPPGTPVKFQSIDHSHPPRLSPPPPTEAIPLGLGPDGKNLLPKLGPDGQPLKGPPLDKDGKPLPPPPIIGPDGKELPRPKDPNGRPLPIYVSPEGKPVLDKDGNPIPLRFNKEGKPIPLEIEYPGGDLPQNPGEMGPPPGGDGPNAAEKSDKIPDGVFYAGIVDIVASFIVAAIVIYFMTKAYESDMENPLWKFLTGSIIVSIAGAGCGALPMIGSKKNQFNFLWIWSGAAIMFLIIELGLLFSAPEPTVGGIIPTAFCGIRLVYTLCTNCIFASNDANSGQQGQQGQYNQQYNAAVAQGSYPRGDTGYYHYNQQQQQMQQPAMVIQQPTTSTIIHQPVVVQQPIMSYGYGYPMMGYGFGAGWGGWGGGYSHGYAPYYDFGWGWGSHCHDHWW